MGHQTLKCSFCDQQGHWLCDRRTGDKGTCDKAMCHDHRRNRARGMCRGQSGGRTRSFGFSIDYCPTCAEESAAEQVRATIQSRGDHHKNSSKE